jgi:cell division protein ZapA
LQFNYATTEARPAESQAQAGNPGAPIEQGKQSIMSETKSPIKVHLLGKEYPIVCPQNEEHDLLIAARYLDDKMRQIRDTGRVFGAERIAVMAALNIAHELIQLQQQNRLLSAGLNERLSAMHEKIDATLAE